MTNQPLYKNVRDQIVESLIRREWQPGDTMPSERQLATRYSVGISTVRAAIGELVASNVLIRRQGKGTCIARHSTRDNLYRFFNVVRNDGVKDPFHRELIGLKKEKADAKTAASLQLPAGKRALDILRVRIKLSVRNSPVAIAEIVVPVRLFPQLDVNGVPDGAGSLYSLYQATYGVNIIKVIEQLFAVKASASIARPLGLPAGEPVLEIRRIGYTFNEAPVELRTTWVHTRHHHYLIVQGGTSA